MSTDNTWMSPGIEDQLLIEQDLISEAEQRLEAGDREAARELLEEVQRMRWSR